MTNIEIKQGVEKIADGEISKADAAFIKGQIDVINHDKTKNYFDDFIKANKEQYKTIQDNITLSLNNYLKTDNRNKENDDEIQLFISNLQKEYHEEINPTTITPDKSKLYEPIYTEGKPLESMVANLNTILPVDKKLPEAAEMRTNMRNNILTKIDAILDKSIKDKGKRGELKNEMKNWFANELTDKRMSNLITGSMYVTIHNIDKKIKAPDAMTVDNFNLVSVNLFKDIKDINSLLATNGDWLKNILTSIEDKVTRRIKEKFSKGEMIFSSAEEFKLKLANMNNARGVNKDNPESISFEAQTDNPIYKLFKEDIVIDTEQDVINLIQGNSTLKEPINPEEIATPQKIQENLYKKANEIMSSIPLDPHEREAFKTGLMQNKIGGWPKDIVKGFFDLIKGTKLFNLFKGLFGNTLDKLFLSKSRNDAKEGALHYADLKKNEADKFKTDEVDKKRGDAIINNDIFKKIQEPISANGLYYTLTKARKYIYPDSKTPDAHKKKFMDDNATYDQKNFMYNNEKITQEFTAYVAMINTNWEKAVTTRMVDEKGKDVPSGGKVVTYKYADIIKSESDLIEHFFNYVQSGEYPDQYSDKAMFEDLKGPRQEPKKTDTPPPITDGDPSKTPAADTKPEVVPQANPVEKAAQEFAAKVKGKVEISKKWTNSFYVKNPANGKITMFKPADAKAITTK